MRFEIYQDGSDLWRWRLVAKNNKVIADGSEGYLSERNVMRALQTVQRGLKAMASAPIKKGEWKKSTSGPSERNLNGILLSALSRLG